MQEFLSPLVIKFTVISSIDDIEINRRTLVAIEKALTVVAFLHLAADREVKSKTALVHMIPSVVGHPRLAFVILIYIPRMVQNEVRVNIDIFVCILQLWIDDALNRRIPCRKRIGLVGLNRALFERMRLDIAAIYVDERSHSLFISGIDHPQLCGCPGYHEEGCQVFNDEGHQFAQFKYAQLIPILFYRCGSLPFEHLKRHLDAGSKGVCLSLHPFGIVFFLPLNAADHLTLDLAGFRIEKLFQRKSLLM